LVDLSADDRPLDPTPASTADLPPTPLRDRAIPATAWREAPPSLLALDPVARYLRRVGPWLLWRSGSARGDATVWAARADDLAHEVTLRIELDGTASGLGPTGTPHTRFRTWKEDLRDHP
jgi:hypothetical protein